MNGFALRRVWPPCGISVATTRLKAMPTDDQTPSGSHGSDCIIGHAVRILDRDMVNGPLIAAAGDASRMGTAGACQARRNQAGRRWRILKRGRAALNRAFENLCSPLCNLRGFAFSGLRTEAVQSSTVLDLRQTAKHRPATEYFRKILRRGYFTPKYP